MSKSGQHERLFNLMAKYAILSIISAVTTMLMVFITWPMGAQHENDQHAWKFTLIVVGLDTLIQILILIFQFYACM